MAIRNYILLLFTIALLNSATAQTKGKTSENPTFMQKVYHDMTTRFNYFFNARLKLNQSLEQIQASNKDNYDELLPVRVYSGKEKRSSMGPGMDEVVKKSSIAIQLHKISKWVDDCYLLMAKANFFKGDYESSIKSLKYINNQYGNSVRNTDIIETAYDKELKKREKEIEEDDTGKSKAEKELDARKRSRDAERENQMREREQARAEKAKKKEAAKAKKDKKKNQDASRKEKAKERDDAKKDKDKERKERVKEREKEAKERAKERDKKSAKDYNKDKAKAAKERQKGQSAKDYNKAKKQAAKDRAKGKKPSSKEKEKIDEVYEELEAQKNESNEKDATAEKAAKEADKLAKEEARAAEKAAEASEKEAKEAEKLAKGEAKKKDKAAKKKRKNEEQALDGENTKGDFSGRSSSDGGFGHKMVKEEAQLWMAENYMEMGNQQSALIILDDIAAENNLPKKLREQYYTLKAIYAVDNELWAEGMDALKNAIKHTRKRSTKARYYFILAQINQQLEKYGAATASFKKVLKNRPVYDMEFNTRLKMAQTLMLSDPGSKNIALRSLKKMLKDEKNEDYADQIHFTLAEVELADGNIDGAIESLKESAASSTNNKNQKGQSFLKLAEIYFEQESYQNSAAFYDSAMVFISKDVENYEEIEERKETLVKLAGYLYTIELEDSLQKLAKLPVAVRNDIIDQKIDEILDAAAEANAEVEQGADFSDMTDLNQNTTSAPAFNAPGQAFYFYNETSKGKGYTNFKNRWGNRSLTDWWGISSKGSNNGGDDAFESPAIANFAETENELQALAQEGELTRDFFIEQLPLDEAGLKASEERIIESLYQSGNIYKEGLQKNEEAKTAYSRLLNDYKKNPYDLETNYQLYLIYKEENNTALSNKHKQYILDNFPDSNYAQIIGNPDYAATLNAVDEELNDHYKAAYRLFKKEAYEQVIEKSEVIGNDYSVNPLKHKFDFLAAQAIGYTQAEDAYVSALENVINNYPGTDVEEVSKEILEAIKNKTEKGDGNKKSNAGKKDAASKYKTNLKEKHFVLVHYPQKTNAIKEIQNEISLFNAEFFSLEKYKVNDNLIDNNNHILVVRTFKNGADAITYYERLRQEASAALGKAKAAYSVFAISKSNFTTYLTSIRKPDETALYMSFFDETYLNQ